MKENIWSTNDFYSAVLVRASGIPLVKLTREQNNFVVFHFSAIPEHCEEIIKKHWDRSLVLETRLLIETIKELRTRIHERVQETT